MLYALSVFLGYHYRMLRQDVLYSASVSGGQCSAAPSLVHCRWLMVMSPCGLDS